MDAPKIIFKDNVYKIPWVQLDLYTTRMTPPKPPTRPVAREMDNLSRLCHWLSTLQELHTLYTQWLSQSHNPYTNGERLRFLELQIGWTVLRLTRT